MNHPKRDNPKYRGVILILFVVLFSYVFPVSFVHAQDDGVAADITTEANVAFSFEGSVEALLDDNVDTYVPVYNDEFLQVSFNNPAGWFYFEWYAIPMDGYVLRQYSADGQIISEDSYTKDGGYLNHGVRVSEATRMISVTVKGDGGALSAVRLYSEGEKPSQLQIWKPRFLKTDLVIFSSHPDDEQLFFGTVLPLYAGEYKCATGVVYMSHQKRLRQSEALAGLWLCGQINYPTFAGYPDYYCFSAAEAAMYWGKESTLEYVIRELRKYKPEVVVTHAADGEYGHGMHKFLAATLLQAVEQAADSSVFPESAEVYGSWQVKKLYFHGSGAARNNSTGQSGRAGQESSNDRESVTGRQTDSNPAELPYDRPLPAFGGRTAFEMAVQGYDCHPSQHGFDFHVSVDNKFSCAVFNLAFSMVGKDSARNNLFENIPVDCFSNPESFRRMRADDMTVRGHRFLAPRTVSGAEGTPWQGRKKLVLRYARG